MNKTFFLYAICISILFSCGKKSENIVEKTEKDKHECSHKAFRDSIINAMNFEAGKKPDGSKIIELLKQGNERYVNENSIFPHYGKDRIKLASEKSQNDYAIATILSCSDSRVPVEYIFDCGIMDLFIVRIAGNVADGDEIGSIEYGCCHVKTPLLVVLGHTQCGAVTAVTHAVHGEGHELERNIPGLVDNIFPAVETAMKSHPDAHGDEIIPFAINENVFKSIEDIFVKSPAIREKAKKGELKVVGALYKMETGIVEWLADSIVSNILTKVEAMPNLEKEIFASKKH